MRSSDRHYAALTEAARDIRPACADDWRFVQDPHTIDDADLIRMRHVCRTCPLRTPCHTYATAARPAAGLWAGEHYGARHSARTVAPRARDEGP